jgi:hypothetical protein
MCADCFGAQVNWLLGYPEKGLELGRAALALAERIAHPFSLVQALVFNAMLNLDCGEPETALQQLDAAEALAAEHRSAAGQSQSRVPSVIHSRLCRSEFPSGRSSAGSPARAAPRSTAILPAPRLSPHPQSHRGTAAKARLGLTEGRCATAGVVCPSHRSSGANGVATDDVAPVEMPVSGAAP